MSVPITGVRYSRLAGAGDWKALGRPDLVVASRDPRYYPFASESPWNIGIGSGAIFEANTAGTPTYAMQHASVGSRVNSLTWSVSVGVAKPTDPWVTVTCETSTKTWLLQIPSSLTATGGSDGWVTVISADGRTGYEFYAAKKNATTGAWSTRYDLVITDLLGHGIDDGRRAMGTSQLAGLVRAQELAARKIDHAIGLAIPNTLLKLTPTSADGDNRGTNSSGSGWVWPARMSDNQANVPYSTAPDAIAMGSMFGIPPGVDIGALGLNADALAVADACQRKGAFVCAASATYALAVEPAANQTQVGNLNNLTTGWTAVVKQLRRVTNNRGGLLNGDRSSKDPFATLGSGAHPLLLPQPTP